MEQGMLCPGAVQARDTSGAHSDSLLWWVVVLIVVLYSHSVACGLGAVKSAQFPIRATKSPSRSPVFSKTMLVQGWTR